MAGKNKSNGRKRRGLDEIDRQILEIKAVEPDVTLREIAKRLDISASTVCMRLKRIPDQPWIKAFSTKLDELLPLAIENMAERLGSDDADRRRCARRFGNHSRGGTRQRCPR